MPERLELGTTRVITDDDTGMYYIGEVESGWNPNRLNAFLEQNGKKGYEELVQALAVQQAEVVISWRKIRERKAEVENLTDCVKMDTAKQPITIGDNSTEI